MIELEAEEKEEQRRKPQEGPNQTTQNRDQLDLDAAEQTLAREKDSGRSLQEIWRDLKSKT